MLLLIAAFHVDDVTLLSLHALPDVCAVSPLKT